MGRSTGLSVIVLILCSCVLSSFANDDEKVKTDAEKKLADQLIAILDHYKQDDPVGLPGVEIPDPMPTPNMKHSFSVASMSFSNMNVYGLKKFRIIHIKSEISAMQVNAALKLDVLDMKGNYTMSTWISRSAGPFAVHLTDVNVQGFATLAVERDGKLRAQDIKMDITFGRIEMNFENLGFMGSMFQGIVNSVGTFLFDSIKPFILKEAYTTLRERINENLEKVAGDMEFPNSISPLDMVIAETRSKVKSKNLDPYAVKNYNLTRDFYRAELTNTWITGLSSFYRVGNISISIENNTLIADFEVGTQSLEGRTNWEISFVGILSRSGIASFSVDYFSVRFIFAQPLDTRKRPQFRDLQIELGNIQMRFDGAGTLDYVVEFAVNILPNLLRYQIIDAIEGPIMDKVQEKLDIIDVEDLIKSKVKSMDVGSLDKFKLSALKDGNALPEDLNIFDGLLNF